MTSICETLFWLSWGVVAYTYILFPLALAICAKVSSGRHAGYAGYAGHTSQRKTNGARDEYCTERSGQAEPAQQASLPRVAMIVAAFNEENCIEAKLANAWAIDYPPDLFQIYVGSDGSTDRTDDILRACRHPQLHAYCFNDRRGKISVLNELVERVDADIIVMSDANTMYAPDTVRLLVEQFADSAVGCASGELRLEQEGGVSGEGMYWKYEQWIKRNESRLGFLIGSNGAVFALRRELYQPLPRTTIIEDFVLTMRVLEQGYRVVFVPRARVTEPPCVSARAEMIRKIRIGAGGFQALGLTYRLLLPKYGLCAFAFWGHKVIRWLVPLFLLAAMAANVALARMPAYSALLALQLAAAAIAISAYVMPEGTKTPKWARPAAYFYIMNYALFLGFLRFLFRTQRVTWDRFPVRSSPAQPIADLASTAVVRTFAEPPNPQPHPTPGGREVSTANLSGQ